jgi:integrase
MTRPRPNPTLAAYSKHWLALCAPLKPGTVEEYESKLRRHILPTLGRVHLRDLTRGHVKSLLAQKLGARLSRDTVRLIHATLRAMLAAAVDDELLESNPAAGVGRSLHLGVTKDRSESIKAMDRGQLAAFLAGALTATPAYHPLFWLMSRTGVRLGEALALQSGDFDGERHQLRVERALSRDGVTTPKSGHGRTVDLAETAARIVDGWAGVRAAVGLEQKEQESPWLFPGTDGQPIPHGAAQAAFRRARGHAGLPAHFTPHSLRHTYASILLAEGVSPAYVQQQLGHSSIELTVGSYGRWLRKKPPEGALDSLEQGEGAP